MSLHSLPTFQLRRYIRICRWDHCFLNDCTCRLGIRAQWDSSQCFCHHAWQPIHSSTFLQLDGIRVHLTCCLVLSTRTWQHRLTSGNRTASLRCFTNAHSGKTHITLHRVGLAVCDRLSNQNVSCSHCNVLVHPVQSRVECFHCRVAFCGLIRSS